MDGVGAGLTPELCEQARQARDPRFDGRFFVAVLTTGVFCRPVCPAPLAKAVHHRFFATAAAAEAAGYRPCLRCRPERSALTASLGGDEAELSLRALQRIEQGLAAGLTVAGLAADLGVSSRHLQRVLQARCGVGPKALIDSQRRALAKRLLEDSDLGMEAVAAAAGYGSERRLRAAMVACWQRSPTALRRLARQRSVPASASIRIHLPARGPFDAAGLQAFLARRAVPGLERVDGQVWERAYASDRGMGRCRLRLLPSGVELCLTAAETGSGPLPLAAMLTRVRGLTDLDADAAIIDGQLAADPLLQADVAQRPGVRVPGCWDPFEAAVRAILGQQVSVAAARTLTGRLLQRCTGIEPAVADGLVLFPSARRLAVVELSGLGLPAARQAALRGLAEAVCSGRLDFSRAPARWQEVLPTLAGIGPWTVAYLAMRAGRDPDALPAADLVLRQRLGRPGRPASARTVLQRAARWRPWRAYAVLRLWTMVAA